jgi:DNA polymerase-3 subunit epsilon
MQEYIVLDLETTGLDPYKGCEIIEIGITKIVGREIKKNFSRLIKPEKEIPEFITRINNITNDMVKDAKRIEEVLPKFRQYIGDRPVIAHNAKFDMKFINYFLNKYELEPITKHICTLNLLKKNSEYKGKNHKLETACEYYNIENKNAHRADSDTLATAKLFCILTENK